MIIVIGHDFWTAAAAEWDGSWLYSGWCCWYSDHGKYAAGVPLQLFVYRETSPIAFDSVLFTKLPAERNLPQQQQRPTT